MIIGVCWVVQLPCFTFGPASARIATQAIAHIAEAVCFAIYFKFKIASYIFFIVLIHVEILQKLIPLGRSCCDGE